MGQCTGKRRLAHQLGPARFGGTVEISSGAVEISTGSTEGRGPCGSAAHRHGGEEGRHGSGSGTLGAVVDTGTGCTRGRWLHEPRREEVLDEWPAVVRWLGLLEEMPAEERWLRARAREAGGGGGGHGHDRAVDDSKEAVLVVRSHRSSEIGGRRRRAENWERRSAGRARRSRRRRGHGRPIGWWFVGEGNREGSGCGRIAVEDWIGLGDGQWMWKQRRSAPVEDGGRGRWRGRGRQEVDGGGSRLVGWPMEVMVEA